MGAIPRLVYHIGGQKQCCDPDSLKIMNASHAETISLVCFGVFSQVTEKIASVHSTVCIVFNSSLSIFAKIKFRSV